MKLIILACLIYLIASLTPTCPSGQVLSNLNVCIKPSYIEGCHQYASVSKCYECVYNYVLDVNGKCQYAPDSSKACCRQRNVQTGACEVCEVGLVMEGGRCEERTVIGCLAKDEKGVCYACDGKYYLENGKCIQGVENCLQYITIAETKICDQCQPGHSLINNACLPNSILGCKSQSSNSCLTCYQPFLPKDNHCQVPNCQSHNQFGCVTCECGYYLTPDRKCSQIAQGCIRYNRGVCTDCMQHFTLKGGVCDIEGCNKIEGVRCVECKLGYESTELGCRLRNCLIAKDGVCEVCGEGFHRLDGNCVEQQKVQTVQA